MTVHRMRKGFVAFYALIVILIAGFYFSGLQFATIDQAMGNRYEQFETQARLAGEAGLEVCLQIATSTMDRFGSFTFDLSEPGLLPDSPQRRYVSSFTVFYSTTQAVATYSYASVTVHLSHQAGAASWPLAFRHFANEVDVVNRRFNASYTLSQFPQYTWKRAIGGGNTDTSPGLRLFEDGSCLFAGETNSLNGDLLGRPGGSGDGGLWGRILASGSIATCTWIEGTGADRFNDIRETDDGGIILVGETNSASFPAMPFPPVYLRGNQLDFIVVKLGRDLQVQWHTYIGGDQDDIAYAVELASDGSFLIAGTSSSNTGVYAPLNHGNSDVYLVHLASNGSLLAHNCFGGAFADQAFALRKTQDSHFVFLGYTRSNNNGDVWGYRANDDIWFGTVTENLSLVATRTACFGGTQNERGLAISLLPDNGEFLIAGYSNSSSIVASRSSAFPALAPTPAALTARVGGEEGWVTRIASSGEIIWQDYLGGSNNDRLYAIKQTRDGNILAAGYTGSNNGDVTDTPHGGIDAVIFKFTMAGSPLFNRRYGGSSNDAFYSLQETFDNGLVFGGQTTSSNGDVSGFHGGTDVWVVKTDGEGNL